MKVGLLTSVIKIQFCSFQSADVKSKISVGWEKNVKLNASKNTAGGDIHTFNILTVAALLNSPPASLFVYLAIT